MSEYSGIRGTRVKYLASDPTLNTSTEGQVWYNSTSGTLKSLVQIKAWSSGGALPAVRSGSGGAGTQTAALNIGGENGSSIFGTTEEYNGFSWSSGGTLNASPSFMMGAGGIQTAALRVGGFTGPVGTTAQDAVEEYNGTSWASETAIPTATGNGMFAGTTTQGLFFGGQTPPTVTTSLSYNGTTWTATNSLAVAKATGAGFGTQTAALASGGSNPALGPGTTSFTNNVQTWDGTNWTTTTNLNTARTNLRGWGSNTNGAVAGGRPASPNITTATEEFDGTNWTAGGSLGTAAYLGATAGGSTISNGLYAGGGRGTGAASTITEEYNSNINAITKAAWSSGGTLNTARYGLASANAAPQNAGLGFGGYNTGVLASTESYNGSTWTTQPSLSTARVYLEGAGTQTAALAFGGVTFVPGVAARNETEEYGGSWTSGGAMNTAAWDRVGAGTQIAALASGGQTPSATANSEEYNGTSWTEGNNLPTTKRSGDGFGTQTAALYAGGGGAPYSNATLLYDGTSWTVSPATLNYGRIAGGAAGIQTLGFYAGGYGAPGGTATEDWNGIAWSTSAPLSISRTNTVGAGSQAAGLVFGGEGPALTATEEYAGGSSVTTASTLTTS